MGAPWKGRFPFHLLPSTFSRWAGPFSLAGRFSSLFSLLFPSLHCVLHCECVTSSPSLSVACALLSPPLPLSLSRALSPIHRDSRLRLPFHLSTGQGFARECAFLSGSARLVSSSLSSLFLSLAPSSLRKRVRGSAAGGSGEERKWEGAELFRFVLGGHYRSSFCKTRVLQKEEARAPSFARIGSFFPRVTFWTLWALGIAAQKVAETMFPSGYMSLSRDDPHVPHD